MKLFWLLSAIGALALSSTGASSRITESRIPLGKFTLVEEVSALGPDETPIMHVNQHWTKLHLVFSSADNTTKVDVVDDGGRLEIAIESGGCLSRSYPFSYGEDDKGRKLHAQMERWLNDLFKLCPKLTPARKSTHLAELRQARSEFPAALQRMKARAAVVFGGWRRRCTKYSSEPSGNPFWGPECVRYSARSN